MAYKGICTPFKKTIDTLRLIRKQKEQLTQSIIQYIDSNMMPRKLNNNNIIIFKKPPSSIIIEKKDGE